MRCFTFHKFEGIFPSFLSPHICHKIVVMFCILLFPLPFPHAPLSSVESMSEQGFPSLAFLPVSLLYLFTLDHSLNFGEVTFSKRKNYHPYTSAHMTAEVLTLPATEGWKGCEMRAKRGTDPELNVEQKEGGSCRQEREELRRERRREEVTGEGYV